MRSVGMRVGMGLLWVSLGWSPGVAGQAAAPGPTEPVGQTSEPGAPDAQVQADYRKIVADAVAEYDSGNIAEARAFFLRAHELWPSARTYRTLGMTSYELRQYVTASEELEASLADPRRPLDASMRAEVTALLEKARALVGRYTIELSPPGARLLLDGSEVALAADGVLRLNLGPHVLVARAPDHTDETVRLTVQGREVQTLVIAARAIQPPPAAVAAVPAAPAQTAASNQPARSEGHPWSWIAGAATLAFGASTVGLFVASNAEYERLDAECMGTCDEGGIDTSKYDAMLTATRVMLGLTLAAGAGTVVAIVLESGDSEGGASAALRFGPGAVALDGRF